MDTVMKGTKANDKRLAISGCSDTVKATETVADPSMSCFPPDDNPNLQGVGGKDRDAFVELQVRSRLLFKVNVILLLLLAWRVWHKYKKKKYEGSISPSLSTHVCLGQPSSDDVCRGKQEDKIERQPLYRTKTTAAAPAMTNAMTVTVSSIMLIMIQAASRWMLFISIAYWAWLHLCIILQQQANHLQSEIDAHFLVSKARKE
jgi:hypothetical protein